MPVETISVRTRRWCWRCLRFRRFRERSWPPLDETVREHYVWWEDSRGHRR